MPLILASVLKKKRISKLEFGRRLGIDQRNLSKLFRKGYNPRVSTLYLYAKVIGCKARDLIK